MLSFLKNTPSTENEIRPAYPTLGTPGPQSSLGYGSNNQYPQYPPKMSDGRSLVSAYQPDAMVNRQLLQDTGIKSNWEYRRYLTRNSENIVKYNYTEALNDVGYLKRFVEPPKPMYTGGPVWYSSYQEKPVGPESDLKQLYLSREQLQAMKVVPSITQAELFEKHGKKWIWNYKHTYN